MMRLIRNALRREDGAMAVEFSLILPVMITMFFGLIELTDAVMAKRRVGMAASVVGDLATTLPGMRDNLPEEYEDKGRNWLHVDEVDDIVDVAEAVLEPYGLTDVTITVTVLTWDATQDEVVVVWSRRRDPDGTVGWTNKAGYMPGQPFGGEQGKRIMQGDEEIVGADYHVALTEFSYPFTSSLSNVVFKKFQIEVDELRVPRKQSLLHFCDDTICTDGTPWDPLNALPLSVVDSTTKLVPNTDDLDT